MLFQILFVSLAAVALADITHPPLDPVCPEGFHPGLQINNFQLDQPFYKFYERTKSFFDIEWYGGVPANYTNGSDNTPGAIRGGTYANGAYKELLVAYDSDDTSLYQKYVSLIQNELTVPAKPKERLIMHSYTEQFTFSSICAGKATELRIMVVFCANDHVAVADAWNLVRVSSLQTLAVELHADNFVGNCPCSGSDGEA